MKDEKGRDMTYWGGLEKRTTTPSLRELHDRLGAMIDQVGQPDYSLRELVDGMRQVRDALFAQSEILPKGNTANIKDSAMRAKIEAELAPSEITPTAPDRLVKIELDGSTHVRTAKEWIDLSRVDLRGPAVAAPSAGPHKCPKSGTPPKFADPVQGEPASDAR